MRTFRTGIGLLDALVPAGFRPGVLVLYGPSDSGVSTTGLTLLRTAEPDPVGLIHLAGQPDSRWIQQAGPKEALIACPETGELAIEAAYRMLLNGVRVVVIDPLPAMASSASIAAPLGSYVPHADRRLVEQGLHVLRATAKARGALVVVGNQIRWHPEVGVRQFLYDTVDRHSDHRLHLFNLTYRTAYGRLAEQRIKATVEVANSRHLGDSVKFSIWPRKGVDRDYETLMLLTELGLLLRRGAWWRDPERDNLLLGPGYRRATKRIRRDRDHYKERLQAWTQSKSS